MSEGIVFSEQSSEAHASMGGSDPLARELAAKYVQIKEALEKARATTHSRERWHQFSKALDALHWIAQAQAASDSDATVPHTSFFDKKEG